MFVMSLASQKGGSGKTTLSGHIAVEAERQGAGPVAVIDADPQGSLADWWNARAAETPLFARTSPLEPDTREGILAFVEHRKPNWRGEQRRDPSAAGIYADEQ